jgi:hypothetical protein
MTQKRRLSNQANKGNDRLAAKAAHKASLKSIATLPKQSPMRKEIYMRGGGK